MVFRAPSDGRIKLDRCVVGRLREFAQRDPRALEAGGVLLGRHISGSGDIVVDEATTPQPADRRTRASFHRSREQHQRLIVDAHTRSQGTCGYLGEWHTHPEPRPSPSGVDLRDWRRRLRADAVDGRHVLFIIVGTVHVCVWRGDRDANEIEQLEAIDVIDDDSAQDGSCTVDAGGREM
ncbi:MAG: Mov34/MPN/PAD-1 family protein [Deltaproteobacteria bacterium]|nr:Mov34/MPN/PAD-1 family protein [Deltaproteobacteria bacterium]